MSFIRFLSATIISYQVLPIIHIYTTSATCILVNTTSTQKIMVFCSDKKPQIVVGKFDAELHELHELGGDFLKSPGSLAASRSKKPSLDASSEVEDFIKEDTNDPPPFIFPPPPVILTESSEEQIQLKHSANTKLKILIFIATLCLIVVSGFGAWSISVKYGNQATTSDGSNCNHSLEAKLEVSLKELNVLKESLANLTRLLQDSLTSTSGNVVDQS